jgi:S1-C subfamily serine protease
MMIRAASLVICVVLGACPAVGQSLKGIPDVPSALVEPGQPLDKDVGSPVLTLPAGQLDEIGSDLPLEELARISKLPTTDVSSQSRSAKDAQLYRTVSPSVVLIVTKTALGSGSLIGPYGEVLTNFHVVKGYGEVGVVFKPAIEGKRPAKDDILTGFVVKYDEVADLALVKVANAPAGAPLLRLGDSSEISVGLDVHAIGHPTGETWTYTKGIISQYRLGSEWQEKGGIIHKADVIQTQTPINPGNSGGPLLSEAGTLLGVNSFKRPGEGLNFAVSVDDVNKFLARTGNRVAKDKPVSSAPPPKRKCQSKEVSRWRSKENDSTVIGFDLNCWGNIDATWTYPDNLLLPLVFQIDRNHDGKMDMAVLGSRPSIWVVSFWDANFDGQWSLVGYHDDGTLKPTRFESYEEFRRRLADPNTVWPAPMLLWQFGLMR